MIRQPFVVPVMADTSVMHGQVRTLADMTEDEVRAIEAKYGMPVRPRSTEVTQDLADEGRQTRDDSGGSVQAHEDAVPVVQAKQKHPA